VPQEAFVKQFGHDYKLADAKAGEKEDEEDDAMEEDEEGLPEIKPDTV